MQSLFFLSQKAQMCKNQKQQSNVAIFIDRQKYKWYIDNRKSAFSRLIKECSAHGNNCCRPNYYGIDFKCG